MLNTNELIIKGYKMKKMIMMIMMLGSVLYGDALDICSSKEIKTTINDLILDEYTKGFPADREPPYLRIRLENIRLKDLDFITGLITCKATKIEESTIVFIKDNKLVSKNKGGKPQIHSKQDITYTLQETSDGKMYIEIFYNKEL